MKNSTISLKHPSNFRTGLGSIDLISTSLQLFGQVAGQVNKKHQVTQLCRAKYVNIFTIRKDIVCMSKLSRQQFFSPAVLVYTHNVLYKFYCSNLFCPCNHSVYKSAKKYVCIILYISFVCIETQYCQLDYNILLRKDM